MHEGRGELNAKDLRQALPPSVVIHAPVGHALTFSHFLTDTITRKYEHIGLNRPK